MPIFSYTFKDAVGAIQKGTADAESEELLRKRFEEQGFTITEITMIKAKSPKTKSPGKVKLTDLSVWCRQFSTMVDAGVSLVRCLDVLGNQTQNKKLKKIIGDLGTRVEAGESLSRAMQRHPKAFSSLFIGLIKAGEVGGVLEESLQRLSHFLEKDVELRRKVKSALTYPVLVAVMASGITLFLVYWFVPQWAAILVDLGLKADDLPAPTKFLIDISNVLVYKGWIVVVSLVILIIAHRLFVSTRFGRRVMDRVKLKVPVFGKLHHKICMARFSRTMGTLLTSGVPILQAMETVAGTVGNTIMSDAILEARARIREGDRIGDPLEESKLFPPMVVHMIGVGEESGSLDFMLQKIADFYENEVEAALASLTAALEPIMIVSLGFVVGFIVISMFLPLVKVIASLSSGGGDDS
ncbi:MAG: type II secretion system F family protein [Armatimonadetes bacterium]|nr:type II secretion system F family protein [Armatimonadota bacterium]MBS1703386.1 type II secretion system F family protein [Armatimonadota bacterium]MBS1727469.1 type II secretion system F family protein [Armatimonadota bacterium]